MNTNKSKDQEKMKKREALPVYEYLTRKMGGKTPQNLPSIKDTISPKDPNKSNMYFIYTQLQHYFMANTHHPNSHNILQYTLYIIIIKPKTQNQGIRVKIKGI